MMMNTFYPTSTAFFPANKDLDVICPFFFHYLNLKNPKKLDHPTSQKLIFKETSPPKLKSHSTSASNFWTVEFYSPRRKPDSLNAVYTKFNLVA